METVIFGEVDTAVDWSGNGLGARLEETVLVSTPNLLVEGVGIVRYSTQALFLVMDLFVSVSWSTRGSSSDDEILEKAVFVSTSNLLVERVGIVGFFPKSFILVMNLLVSINWSTRRSTSNNEVLELHVRLLAWNSSHLLVERIGVVGFLTQTFVLIMDLFVSKNGTTWSCSSFDKFLEVQLRCTSNSLVERI